MALVETEALVLKSYNLADADKIVVFFTKDRGLVRGVAKGAKRLKSKFGGGLEVFSVVNLTYRQKEERELVFIEQIELERSYFEAAGDPKFLDDFGYLVDLLSDFAPPNESNPNMFRMALACLETSSAAMDKLDYVVFYFEFWLLKLGGFLPKWNECGKCRRAIEIDETVKLQYDFRLLCGQCSTGSGEWVINPEERSLFLTGQSLSPDKFVTSAPEFSTSLLAAQGFLRRIISTVLDKDLRSSKARSIRP